MKKAALSWFRSRQKLLVDKLLVHDGKCTTHWSSTLLRIPVWSYLSSMQYIRNAHVRKMDCEGSKRCSKLSHTRQTNATSLQDDANTNTSWANCNIVGTLSWRLDKHGQVIHVNISLSTTVIICIYNIFFPTPFPTRLLSKNPAVPPWAIAGRSPPAAAHLSRSPMLRSLIGLGGHFLT